jgi:hypothetical protein
MRTPTPPSEVIREARDNDWPQIWPIIHDPSTSTAPGHLQAHARFAFVVLGQLGLPIQRSLCRR